MRQARVGFSNHRERPHIIAVEPWGEDFTLLPREQLEIVAYSERGVPRFHVVEWEGTSQVYCEETQDFEVLQDGVLLECGHQRQAPE